MTTVDGSCVVVGVPPDRCAIGFEPDGVGGCNAVLPAAACPPGTMAIPGETACREVAPCGEDPFPELPSDALSTAQYVDAAATAPGNGTAAEPWQTIGEAVSAAAPDALIAVAAGTYEETVVISDKAVRIWGRCPALVELRGPSSEATVYVHTAAADGTEIRGLAIVGGKAGVAAADVRGLVLDRVWIHDVASMGGYFFDQDGQAEVLIRDSLLENNDGVGLAVVAALVTVERTAIRDTRYLDDTYSGGGAGVYARAGGPEGKLVLRTSVIERNQSWGVSSSSATVALEGVVIRDTLPRPDQNFGRGLDASNDEALASSVSVTGSVLERNHEIGIFVTALSGTIEDSVVRDMLAVNPALPSGAAIVAQQDPTVAVQTELVVRSSLVERAAHAGIHAASATLRVETTVVRDIAGASFDGTAGRCVSLQYHQETGVVPTADIDSVWLAGCRDFGISIIGVNATVVGSRVESVLPRAKDGWYGDGIVVTVGDSTTLGPLDGHLALSRTVVRDASRAGIAVFGAVAALDGSAIQCNPIDLDGESQLGRDWSIEDLGGNRCGCEEAATCKVQTTSLQPPELP